MPQATDLLGLGMSPFLAGELGNTASTLTCAGTTQATGAVIKSKNVELTAASSQTGALLQSASKIGSPYYLTCSSSTAAVVYVPVGQNLNGVANDSLTLAQHKSAIVWQYKLNNWTSVLTA